MDLLTLAMANALAKQYTDAQLEDLGMETITYHFCVSGEYNTTSGVPTVANPDSNTFYFVPAVSGNGLFNVYIHKNNWTLFTSTELDLSNMPVDDSLSESGMAADAKKTGDEITALKDDLKQLDTTKVKKPITNPNGTSGQFLRTLGDGNTEWVDQGLPTDEQTAEAVEAWLDSHPEATTTVEDGSITKAKLHTNLVEELNQKADGIIAEDSVAYTHSDLTYTEKIQFIGNEYAFDTCKYANRKNLMPDFSAFDYNVGGVTASRKGRFLILSGTASETKGSTFYYKADNSIVPGRYKLIVKVHAGQSVIDAGSKSKFEVFIEGTRRQNLIDVYQDATYEYDVTVNNASPNVQLTLQVQSGNVYTGFTIWYAFYPYDVTIVDTGDTVNSGETYDYEVFSIDPVIDTCQHQSIAYTLTDTKKYIDEHVPEDMLVESDLVYLSPEMFGAAGDGTGNDAPALHRCINEAKLTNPPTPVRAYGRYRITESLIINGRELDIYINTLKYTGNDAAVIVSTQYSRTAFMLIDATVGEEACGIRCFSGTIDGNAVTYTCSDLSCAHIYAKGNTVELTRESGGLFYSTFHFLAQYSYNANIIEVNANDYLAELDIYGKNVVAHNGYLFYCPNESSNGHIRLHQYSMEGNLKNGVYGNAKLIDCRTAELLDKNIEPADPDNDTGYLYDLTGRYPSNAVCFDGVYTEGCFVDYVSVKVDSALSFDDVLDKVAERCVNNVRNPWNPVVNMRVGCFGPCFRYAPYDPTHGAHALPKGKLYAYLNHKVYVPDDEWYMKIDDSTFVTLTNAKKYRTPTVFDINVSETSIYLDDSYCCVGIKHFELIQYNDKKAIIYDKNGDLLFDGTNEGQGCYMFDCVFCPIDEISITPPGMATQRIDGSYIAHVYTGENERWIITKKEMV